MGMLHSERQLWAGGCRCLAGVDEVGRGPLAGPVVVAAVVLDRDFAEAEALHSLAGLTDSKKLSPALREHFYALLRATPAVMIGVGFADEAEIDRINILQATYVAMARALSNLPRPAAHALVDGRPPAGLPCASTAIVGGDGKSLSIAAASVVAKVIRDRFMCDQSVQFPVYGFSAHKGYGTSAHIQALLEHGPSPIHRRSFRPVSEAEAIFLRSRARQAQNEGRDPVDHA